MSVSDAQGRLFSGKQMSLAFASIGVVFGDIGTSPLYAMREALHPVVAAGGVPHFAVFGSEAVVDVAVVGVDERGV